jgi:hypothetical protein
MSQQTNNNREFRDFCNFWQKYDIYARDKLDALLTLALKAEQEEEKQLIDQYEDYLETLCPEDKELAISITEYKNQEFEMCFSNQQMENAYGFLRLIRNA